MTCPYCSGSTRAIELRPGGRRVVVRTCLPCEFTVWELEGRAAGVENVLDLVSETRHTFMRRGAAVAS